MPGSKAPGNSPTIPIDQLAATLGDSMVSLGGHFSYFPLVPLSDEDMREFLFDPLSGLPPAAVELISPARIVLTPYLEKGDGIPRASLERPDEERRLRSAFVGQPETTLVFAVRDEDQRDYHQVFFNTLAHLLSRKAGEEIQARFNALLLEEFDNHVHGEVDEPSWTLKQELALKNGDRPSTRSGKFRKYAAQAFADTMTLYLHGICCDIDVETGPRRIPSRWLRKRLEALYEMFPPPAGRAVFPEHLRARH